MSGYSFDCSRTFFWYIIYSRVFPLKESQSSKTSNHTPKSIDPMPKLKMEIMRMIWTGVGNSIETKITRESVRKQETPRNRPNSDHLA